MLEYSTADLVFHALANETRRAIVDRLSRGPTTVGDLARPLPVSLAAVVQHLQVLESSGLVTTSKQGRVRTCRLDGAQLARAEAWIARRRALWEGRFDRLAAMLDADSTDHPTADHRPIIDDDPPAIDEAEALGRPEEGTP